MIEFDMTKEEILLQNPRCPAPQEVIDSMEIIEVDYYGFDDQVHRGKIAMRKDVVDDVKKFFELALEIKFPIEKVIPISNPKYKWEDMVACEDNNSSGYNYRLIAGTSRLSKHSGGLAFDINPVQNIYVRYDENVKEIVRYPKDGVYNIETKGTLVTESPLVALMKNLGWIWGGDWTPESGRVDYQHFEKNI